MTGVKVHQEPLFSWFRINCKHAIHSSNISGGSKPPSTRILLLDVSVQKKGLYIYRIIPAVLKMATSGLLKEKIECRTASSDLDRAIS